MSDQKYNSPEDPYFEDAQADEFEEEELISKTELKRQAKELHKLGETLVNLTDAHIATIPMDEELADAVAIARKVNKKKTVTAASFSLSARYCASETPRLLKRRWLKLPISIRQAMRPFTH